MSHRSIAQLLQPWPRFGKFIINLADGQLIILILRHDLFNPLSLANRGSISTPKLIGEILGALAKRYQISLDLVDFQPRAWHHTGYLLRLQALLEEKQSYLATSPGCFELLPQALRNRDRQSIQVVCLLHPFAPRSLPELLHQVCYSSMDGGLLE